MVVELIGGLEPAGILVRGRPGRGKPVVTANKALLASPDGVALRGLAQRAGVDLLFEAAVAGAIPLVRALRESLTGERIHRVMGIVNGTTNFILTQMGEQGADYAESWPRRRPWVSPSVTRRPTWRATTPRPRPPSWPGSPSGTTCRRRRRARGHHRRSARSTSTSPERAGVRQSSCWPSWSGRARTRLSVRVHPALVPNAHPLAGVRDAFNAVFIEGEAAGELMLYGQGAVGCPPPARWWAT